MSDECHGPKEFLRLSPAIQEASMKMSAEELPFSGSPSLVKSYL